MQTISLQLTDEQMSAILNLCEPLVDALIDRAAERLKEFEAAKEPRYYSRQEVADLLHVSLPTIHAMMNADALPHHKVGGRVLIPANEVDNAMKDGRLLRGTWRKTSCAQNA